MATPFIGVSYTFSLQSSVVEYALFVFIGYEGRILVGVSDTRVTQRVDCLPIARIPTSDPQADEHKSWSQQNPDGTVWVAHS